MGWKGTLLSVNAALNKADRASRRRQKELDRRRRGYERMEAIERAHLEVEEFENYVEMLQTVHLDGASEIDWKSILDEREPIPPEREFEVEEAAKRERDEYKPSLIDRMFRLEEKKRRELQEAAERAPEEDESLYERAMEEYRDRHKDWKERRDLAERLFAKEAEATLEVIKEFDPFSEASELGSHLDFKAKDGLLLHVVLQAHGEDILPKKKKTLLKSGKLSEKAFPKGEYYELYQDHVCSAILRIARDVFAILPIDSVVVTATDSLLNTATGHIEEQAIVSAAIPRRTLEQLNLRLIDPSDAMENFVHRMDFKKTKGFQAVDALDPLEVPLTEGV